jgi:hypothetical protein
VSAPLGEALADALPHYDWCGQLRVAHWPCSCANRRRELADALLPVVLADREEYGRACAAAALRQAADKAEARAAHEAGETADAFREVALYLRAKTQPVSEDYVPHGRWLVPRRPLDLPDSEGEDAMPTDAEMVEQIRTMIREMRPDQVPILDAEAVSRIVGEPLPAQPPR